MKRNLSCYMVQHTTLLSRLQLQLLKMSAFCPHTCSKTLMPLINCTVNDALVHALPNIQQTLLEFINAVQLRLMQLLLDVTPYLVLDQIKVGAFQRSQISRNESRSWLLKTLHSVACPVHRCAVLFKDEQIAWHVTHHEQQRLYRSMSWQ